MTQPDNQPEWLRLSEVVALLIARGIPDAAEAISRALRWTGPIRRMRFPEFPDIQNPTSRRAWSEFSIELDFERSTVLVPVGRRRVPEWQMEIVEISRTDVDRIWPIPASTDRYASDLPLVNEAVMALQKGTVANVRRATALVVDRAAGNSRDSTFKRLEGKIRAKVSSMTAPTK